MSRPPRADLDAVADRVKMSGGCNTRTPSGPSRLVPQREWGTRIGFMEKVKLETLQLSCLACRSIFYYVNDTDDQLKPKYCPECGRKNVGN
jgi:hypothetical protein